MAECKCQECNKCLTIYQEHKWKGNDIWNNQGAQSNQWHQWGNKWTGSSMGKRYGCPKITESNASHHTWDKIVWQSAAI